MLYVNPLDTIAARAKNFTQSDRTKMAFRELEHVFSYMVLQEMRKTVPHNDLFGDSQMRKVVDGWLDDALSKKWAASGQLGIAQQMADQLRVNQSQQALQKQLAASGKSL